MITLLDTALDSSNAGDGIIRASIFREFPALATARSVPTHRHPSQDELELAKASRYLILTGTNILSGRLGADRQWPLSPETIAAYQGKVIFLGVGWREYEAEPSNAGLDLIRRMRHPGFPVAARDEHTRGVLIAADIPAVNTGCPTMWSLSSSLEVAGRGDEAVFTLTDYRPNRLGDTALMWALARKYKKVVAWPQSEKDETLLRRMIRPPNLRIGRGGLDSLDEYLSNRDYVGTRLHAGIRAAQLGRPLLIVAVDNRAIEISRDTGLPVVPRADGYRAVLRTLSTLREVDLASNRTAIANYRESLNILLDHES